MTAKKWDKSKRYESAQEWIKASFSIYPLKNDLNGHDLDRFAAALASICKKRKGIWSLLKSPPKDGRALIWHAFKIGKHASQWGDLAPWTESVTARLMSASNSEKADFHMVLETTQTIGLIRKERMKA